MPARGALSAAAVGAYIASAYWFTASTSFANPAVTVGRMLSDTFAGIAPGSAPPFVLAQLVGAGVGIVTVLALYPDVPASADQVVVPSEGHETKTRHGSEADRAPALGAKGRRTL